ncbi:matrixin family metalloprotease [Bradyrhizobium sp. B117]|uniref:M10 family metallopeptidase C-terminal domain-containing protein n=1 Tax=Bradyrhizobium sp. B117 TaxID=3140246 RepID=UPI003183B6D7
MATAVNVSATNNADIDGLLAGTKWSGTISYSFPTSSSTYANPYSGVSEPTTSGFATAPTQMQAAINYAIALIKSYTGASITYNGTGSADIMVAQSPAANPTSYAYYPGNYAAGGDIWFGTQYDYTQAKLGNYYFTTALHELGHALGLKHSQETGGVANVAVPSAHDDSEYTVMSYRSYVGGPLTGYTNEAYGYPQTYMANDILALQTLYGANYNTQSGNTVYTWSPTTGQEFINGAGQLAPGGGVGGSANRIYETVWDGNGVDTYDLSNYTTNLTINLNPGASSVFSTAQLAYLGNGHYASGNVYNAYLYNGDARSYIDNATGGSGNDTIIGNAIANVLKGGAGNDTITGGGGNDTIDGGTGTDTAAYSGNLANYAVTYNATTQTFTIADQRAGSPDGTDTITNFESFQFADGTLSSAALINQLTPVVIEAIGTTSLVQVGANYFMNPVGGGTGPELQSNGAPVYAGEFGSWAPIGAVQVGGGYDVAWKQAGAALFTIWGTDANGAWTSNLSNGTVGGSSTTLESFESTFQQDLNGDGVIGIPTTVIHTDGTTSLVQVGANYFLNPAGGGTGPELQSNGAPVYAGEFGSWAPIGAVQVGGGYDVAWKQAGAALFTIWGTDANGAWTSNLSNGTVGGSSTTLESFESTFQQDLNGDGVIGFPTTVIHTDGTTSLVQVGANYFLNPVGGGTGPELQSNGAPVYAGEFGSWAPIGAVQVGGGYDVAWKQADAALFTIWGTDANGAWTSNLSNGTVGGSSTTLESFESTFQQDLNGDGVIGIPTTVIHTDGTTSLVQVGANYFMNPVGGGTGPELQSNGAPVYAGEFGSWAPIGAVQVGGGYDVAWKEAGAALFTIWGTDANGAWTSNLTNGTVGGSSATLESFESTFHQDFNGDGVIGPPASKALEGGASANAAGGNGTFSGVMLTLHSPSNFSGDGTLAGSDKIDLLGMNFQSLYSRFESSSGVLLASDGSKTVTLQFDGQYTQDSFHFVDDSHGGALIVAATHPDQPASPMPSFAVHESFVFTPNFGQVTLANFAPGADTIQFSKSQFADMASLLAATHDDASGNAHIVDAAGDAITLQHVTKVQLAAFQNDFHFV